MIKITNKRLAIGIPLTFPMVPSPFFHSFARLEREDFVYIPATSGPIEELRNDIVLKAKQTSCSHLVMMDVDMLYHPKTLTRLYSLVTREMPVVGALCFRRYPPFDPLLMKGEPNKYKTIMKWEPGELVEVDATGTGCLMFHMSVFDKMPEPWFKFRPNPDPEMDGTLGEDIGFCWDLRNAGYKIFVDTSIPSDHLSTMVVNEKTWKLYNLLKGIQRRKGGETEESGGEEIDKKCVQ